MAKSFKITTLAAAVFGLGLFMTVPSEAATLPVGKTKALAPTSAEAPITIGGWNGGYGWNGGCCRPAYRWGYRRWGYRPWGYGYAGYGYRRYPPYPYYNAYSYYPPAVAIVPVVPVVPYVPPPPVYGGYPYVGVGIGY
jgi:hypothetical protein